MLASLSVGQFPFTLLVRLTPKVENRGWWVMERKRPVRVSMHTMCDSMAVVVMGEDLWKSSVERPQSCPTSMCRRLRDAGPQEMGQTQLAALPSIRSSCVHQNCAHATEPVLVACVSAGVGNNTFRTAPLAGKILSPNANMLLPLDRLPTVLERRKVFQMPKTDCKLCQGTLPS